MKIFNHNLFQKIISLENIFVSWQEFKKDKKKKIDILNFGENLEENLFRLRLELKTKTYRHSHYTSFFISDPKKRHIHKAEVRDRIIHHAVYRVLCPIFDKSFISDSYSCRLGKGTHRAVKRLENFCRRASKNYTRNIFALKCDIKKFFDSVDHQILLDLLKKKIKDKNTLWLLKEVIDSFQRERNSHWQFDQPAFCQYLS